MTKKLNPLQTYYIDNNLGHSDVELAKITGASVRQVKARRAKVQGKNREGGLKGEPEEKVINQATPERQVELENQAKELNAKGNLPAINALIARKNGTVSLTGPASELADMIDGISPGSKKSVIQVYDPFSDETRVHKIRK